jgi:hypothetical protein
MHDVMKRKDPNVECLYVKSFMSYMGPEAAIRQVFLMARRMAPCLLIFEDIDSLGTVNRLLEYTFPAPNYIFSSIPFEPRQNPK